MQARYFNINEKACSVRCKLYSGEPGDVRKVVLFGHGFGGHKDNKAAERLAGRMLEKNRGTALVTFDWPCHGDDVRKTLRLEDCGTYLELVLDWLRGRYPDAALHANATSFGGYLFLLRLARHGNPFTRVALRCPAVNMYDTLSARIMGEDEHKRLSKGKAVAVGFDRKVNVDAAFLESLRENDIRQLDFLPFADELLILQGTKDEVVSFAEVRAFAEQNVIEFVPVENADHRFQDPARMDFAISKALAFYGMR